MAQCKMLRGKELGDSEKVMGERGKCVKLDTMSDNGQSQWGDDADILLMEISLR